MKAEVLAGAAPDLKSAFENHYKLVEEADKIKRKADRAAAVLEKEARKEMDLDPEVEAFLVAKQEAGAKRYKSAAAGGGGAAGAGGGGDEPEDDGDIEDDLAALRMEEAQVASGAGCGGGDEDADEPTIVDKVIAIIKDKMSERDVLRMALTLGWRPSINTTPTTGSRVDHVKTLIRNVLASADINKESGREHIRTLIGTLDALSLFKMLEAALA